MKIQRRHLDYFVAIADAESFSKAAARLFVSQPSLSQQIAQLEEIIGTALFVRGQGKTTLTAAGQHFYTKANDLRRELNAIVNETRMLGESHSLLIGLPDYHMFAPVTEGLRAFSHDNPKGFIAKEMMAADMVQSIEQGEIHFGFIAKPFPFESVNLASICIEKTALQISVSSDNSCATQHHFALADFTNNELILLAKEDNPGFHRYVVDSLNQVGAKPVLSSAQATGLQAQYTLVGIGQGVCLTLTHSPLPSQRLRTLPIEGSPLIHDLHLVWRKDLHHPLAESFKTFFTQPE